jgi:hypothetical protein
MPALVDMVQATPRCDAHRMIRYGQWGVHFTCHEPMRYLADTNRWWCLACGAYTPGARVVGLFRSAQLPQAA